MTQTACLPNTSQGCRKAPLQGAQAGLARSSFRVPRGLARGAAAAKGPRRSAAAAPARLVVCEAKPGSEEGVAAVGRDLSWSHVAADVKRRLGPVVAGKASSADQLQGWLGQAKLTHTGESDAEANQAELVAQTEAENMDLGSLKVDVRGWMEGGEGGGELDDRMVGLLTVRLLQAYHEGAGEPFDDENEDCYWRLQGFLPGALVEALDHETLKRMIKAYMAMPFSGV